ncbi:FecCD family ABC transporter permease [Falsibacillus albus]|uniref:Iron ABC transporter permease n=1 Tax=Falsibacillus albus TaxID=2478915 RepID=A0A3L7JZK1_9BACI|nr:iron ABC transporter permease [Falsibacillus albus]RLQ96217.1 iron ABC transporter permease [Falsibacillus albus]
MRKSYIQTFLQNNILVRYILSIGFLLASLLIGMSIGSISIPVMDILQIVGGQLFRYQPSSTIDPMYTNIIMEIRLPRVLLAGLVGASLAMSGTAFQGLLRNPLADPYTLGVSSGASLGAVITIFFSLTLPLLGMFTLPVFSIATAILTMMIVLLFARRIDRSMKVETIILTGIIFSSFLGSLISLMIALTGDELRQIIGWLLGSVSMRGWSYITLILPFFIFGSILLMLNGRELNALSFGEERAQHLGVNVQRRKLLILAAGSMLTGSAVAVSGTIGFVGLVVPHFCRLLWGPDHRHLLPLSALVGAAFLILADTAARMIISPSELPIGVITSLIGAPIFAIILMKNKRGRR